MRVLAVGGGIAGLTLAGVLSRAGHEVTVVERTPDINDSGYGLGLYRPGSKVLADFGVYQDFLDAGRIIDNYVVGDRHGGPLQTVSMDITPAHVSPFVMIARQDLVRILASACTDIRLLMGTTVSSVQQDPGQVEVVFSDDTRETFDLVVAADGRSAGTTWQEFTPRRVDTRWIYWTWWGPEKLVDATALVDYCGDGWFLGAYPVPGKCMYGVGLPVSKVPRDAGTEQVRAAVDTALSTLVAGIPALGEAAPAADRFYPWYIDDVTHATWARGRIALCGDAAASSIPTAGVGASHAIQGALVLAGELAATPGPDGVAGALRRYQERCRKEVNSNLRQSRLVARTMLARNRIRADARDFILRHYPAEKVIKQLTDSVTTTF